MKKISFSLVFAYTFVAFAFIAILTWLLHYYIPKAEGFSSEINPSIDKVVYDSTTNFQRPYVTTEMDEPDFEGNFEGGLDRIILNKYEGGIEATKDALNMAMVQYPFDWANAPPSARIFQEQNALLLDKDNLERNAEKIPEPMMTKTELNVAKLLPPMTTKEGFQNSPGPAPSPSTYKSQDEALRAYAPKSAEEIGHYTEQDAKDFINKYYEPKGLIPEIVETGEDNVYQVVGFQEKDPKIVWEDEVDNQNRSAWVPQGQSSEFNASTQYSGSRASERTVRTGVSKEEKATNSQLERIFGPGLQWQQWG
jgi:hypothetical protein